MILMMVAALWAAEALESGKAEANPTSLCDQTMTDEDVLTSDTCHWASPHLKRMKMAPVEVRSDGAIGAAAT